MIYDTIAAISSPKGIGAISVIRVSGDKVVEIINSIFERRNFQAKKMYLDFLKYKDEIIDEVTWVYHRKPYSYTGEDMLEIFCHGGPLVNEKILETLFKLGAREALPGEFTKRAVLNGKMDLIKAESINELIFAHTESSLKAAINQMKGELSKQLENMLNELLYLAAAIEVELDYPEDFEEPPIDLKNRLIEIKEKLKHLYENADNGIMTVSGVKTVIVGKPNSGKSTLLNALLREDRAIVTEIPGTTRDTIEEDLNIKGIYIKIIDTAGIRRSKDKVELLGIERTIKAIERGDLILFVLDGTTCIEKEDLEIAKHLENKNVILVVNKMDSEKFKIKNIPKEWKEKWRCVKISAKEKKIKELEEAIYDALKDRVISEEPRLITQRQKQAVGRALDYLKTAFSSLEKNMPSDIVMIDIRKAIEEIENLLGRRYTDDLLNTIFSNFCVGK